MSNPGMLLRSILLFLCAVVSRPAVATCPSEVPIEGDLTCSSDITGIIPADDPNWLGGSCDDNECYTCGFPEFDEPQLAAEHVYTFACQNAGQVSLVVTDLSCDLDIYILDDSCDPNAGCLYGSTAAYDVDDGVIFICEPGSLYYVVIEAYGTKHLDVASGPCTDKAGEVYDPGYTLSFDVSASTGCSEDCDDGEDNDLDGDTDCDDTDCGSDAVCCDLDGDGYFSEDCSGSDCNDSNASISPGAVDIPDNGIDEDCDGVDATTPDTGGGDDGADTGTSATDTGAGDDGSVSSGVDTGGDDGGQVDGDEDGKDGGCGCANAGSVRNGGLMVLLLGLVLGWRRQQD